MVKFGRRSIPLMLLIGPADGDDRARLLALVEDLGFAGFVFAAGAIAIITG